MYATAEQRTRLEIFEDMSKRLSEMDLPMISEIPEVQAHYEKCRAEGTSHTLAEMFAWQIPPACVTDDIFNQGRCNGNQFEGQPWIGDMYRAPADEAGVNTKGATYLHGLASYPGDPKAWVRSRGDVQRVCEERGWGCQGAVNVKGQQPLEDPKQNIAVADDIVEAETHKAIAANPDLARRPFAEVADGVTQRMKPHWAGKKMPKKPLDLAA